MASKTHREYRTWMARFEDELNEPSRTDYYLMAIAGHVAHVMSKKSWKLSDFLVKFGRRDRSSSQDRVAAAKALWRARAGIGKR